MNKIKIKLLVIITLLAINLAYGEYTSGTPGSAWTKKEVDIVRQKIKEMVNTANWRGFRHHNKDPDASDEYDEAPLFVQDGTLSDDSDNNLSATENKFCCNWQNRDISSGQVPTTSKLLRLAFHDCVPYVDEDGILHGGCDGCLNWKNMGTGFPGGINKPVDNTIYKLYAKDMDKGDNNGLQTVVAALELIYTDPAWPKHVTPLNESLKESGKSRADLWQFAGIVALEIEIERANFACDYDFNTGNQVRLLEGVDKCFFKLFKPSMFKFGRKDCIPDETKKVTNFPYEATNEESHPNTYGTADHVLKNLKKDFGLTAEESIALMATHATSREGHNWRLPVKYMWMGFPYMTNMYHKYIAGVGMYRRGHHEVSGGPASVGDWRGKPNMGTLWKLGCTKAWSSNMTENGYGGPCFFRPTNGGCNRPGEERSKICLDHFDDNGNIVLKSGRKDRNLLCNNTVYDENRIQYYLDADERVSNIGSQQCNNELTFALTYEVNFGIDFEVDSEFRPIGCNGDMEKMQWGGKGRGTTVNCPPNLKEYEGKPLSTITRGIAEDHDVWNQAFLSGWEKFAENGYEESELQPGPENSWLGGANTESFEDATYPLIFTDNKKLNPTINSMDTDSIRGWCLTHKPKLCPPEFKIDHEDYYIGRLESPWFCFEEDTTLEKIPVNIINPYNGKVLEINRDSGSIAVAPANAESNQKWTYKPSCDGGVMLTNLETSETISLTYSQKEGTLMNEDGLFALNSRRGLKWVSEVKYLADQPQTPWKRYQWETKRVV